MNKDQCQCSSPSVKLILWPSERPKSKKMWSKLPLRQLPAKMGWLSSTEGSQVKQNAVFRSNSFRFERPPPEDDSKMFNQKQPVKSYSITAQDFAKLNDKYEVPKDFVSRTPLSKNTPKAQLKLSKVALNGAHYNGVHIQTLVSCEYFLKIFNFCELKMESNGRNPFSF